MRYLCPPPPWRGITRTEQRFGALDGEAPPSACVTFGVEDG